VITLNEHVQIEPKILYYGTPVLLLSTLNEDGSTNISPLSSSWALGPYIILGLGIGGRAYENLNRYLECVINLPDPTLWEQVEKLASLTGKHPVPEMKQRLGFRYCKEKFAVAGLTPQPSSKVRPDRIQECPLQIEAQVKTIRVPPYDGGFAIVEAESVCVYAQEWILTPKGYIDPAKWKPLIYNFRHYFSLGQSMGKTFRSEV
jgi:flavin reductase (DIM6/NTAB) family NADH-FMN oxidoreductase RutF